MLLIEGGKLGDQTFAHAGSRNDSITTWRKRLDLGELAPEIVDPARQRRMEVGEHVSSLGRRGSPTATSVRDINTVAGGGAARPFDGFDEAHNGCGK
jgi:hypothetical protein